MTVGRLFIRTVLGALALTAATALVVYAAGGKQEFALSGSPSTQTITQGALATYTVTITRKNGFTGPVALSTTGAPPGSTLTFTPSPAAASSSTLKVQTLASTAPAAYQIGIKGVSGKLTSTATVNLAVQSTTQPNFSLSAPSAVTLLQGDTVSLTVHIVRTGGFAGAVSLSASGLPNKTSATFLPSSVAAASSSAMLTLSAEKNAPEGVVAVTINGSGTPGTRSTSLALNVEKARSFPIAGSASGLYPGHTVPLDLALTNPYNFDLRVTELGVAVEQATSNTAACSGAENFSTSPYSGSGFVLPSGQTKTLSQLRVPQGQWPTVGMENLPANQEGCKNASATLQFSGLAGKANQ